MLMLVIVAVALAAGLWMARPFLRRSTVEMNEAESTISIFRDQLDEIEREESSGQISPEQSAEARREIEHRALKAARELGQGLTVSNRSVAAAALVAVLVVAASLATYFSIGSPLQPDQPLAERRSQALQQQAAAGDLNSRIGLLIEKTEDNPESFEDWWMLARSYAATGDHASAADAYREAARLSGDRPSVLSAYAEALTLANGNKVPTAARLIFEQVLRDEADPRAAYYVALAKAQAQDFAGALEDWARLASVSKPDAPWMPLVRRDIANMARFTGTDVRQYLPDASEAEIAAASAKPADHDAMAARIAELEQALAADPKQYKSWIELAEIRAGMGDSDGAAGAIARARQHFSAAPFVLAKIDEASRGLGLDLIETDDQGVAGPTRSDIAAAAQMSTEDQASMIEGMVAGLAAKLEENPDNAEGWIMLVRSYTVIGDMTRARTAYEDAVRHFEGNQTVLTRLQSEAGTQLQSN